MLKPICVYTQHSINSCIRSNLFSTEQVGRGGSLLRARIPGFSGNNQGTAVKQCNIALLFKFSHQLSL